MRLPPIYIGFLRSKVGRRVFLLFVASALLPLAILALLSIGQVQTVLLEMSQRELAGAAKSYGMALYERLLALEDALQPFRQILGETPAPAQTSGAGTPAPFATVALVRTNGEVRMLRGVRGQLPDVAGLVPSPLTTATQLRVIDGNADSPPRLVLVHAVRDAHGSAWLVAEPRHEYLWGDPEAVPYPTELCVVGKRDQPLFCTRPLPPPALAAVETNTGGNIRRLDWEVDGEHYRAATWTLFLGARFNAVSLRVVASQPESAVLARIQHFRQTFVSVVGLALLIVTLLTMVIVRRRLVPLDRLVDATRRIGNQDFAASIDIRSADEFGELAAALRQMASQLGRQFSALTTWSEIDRMILTKTNIDSVLEVVLQRLPQILPADVIALTVIERDAADLGRTFVRASAHDRVVHAGRTQIPPVEAQLLLRRSEGFVVHAHDPASVFLTPLRAHGAKAAFILPVISKQRLVGIIMLGYTDTSRMPPEVQAHVRELSNRLAVMLSAAEQDEQLYRQAHYDPLTGLPNRLYLRDQLSQELAQAQRLNRRVALLFIDLDRFKDINDTFGHAAGDRLLQTVAMRLRGCVRETDLVARLGGDEFTVILGRLASPRDVQIVAENIMRVLAEPIVSDGRETFVSCSIGVALFPQDAPTADELLRKADTAMYRAKQSGRRRYVFFEEQMNVDALERTTLEQDLYRAVGRDEFQMFFQPQADIRTGQIVGAEMLVRWQHPERGRLMPAQFIGIAENAGLIESLGESLLQHACHEFGTWIRQGTAPERLALNVSSRQFRQTNFADLVRAAIEAADVPPQRLELEITETLLLQDADEVIANFSRLQALGVRLVIDDFGTGYSSLAYLKRFPIHAVKIDRSFIRDVPTSDDAGTLVDTIIAMTNALHREVIAEGVETEAQVSFLRARHCYCIQGHYVSEALPKDQFLHFLRTAPTLRQSDRMRAG